MTQKEAICKSNVFVAWHNVLPWLTIYIHMICDNRAYYKITCGPESSTSYHTSVIRYLQKSGRYYLKTPLGRMYLDQFYRGGYYMYPETYGMKSL